MSRSLVLDRLAEVAIVPVITIDDPADAEPLAAALVAGGLPAAEITFRTPAGEAAIRAIAGRSDLVLGAGTVLTPAQVDRAHGAGATFVVSPGLDDTVVERALELGLVVLPGVATASELQAALRLGLSAVKLFPAAQLGGLAAVSAYSAPFPDVRFMPSGGITAENAAGYLEHPAVFAVGSGWIAPRDLINRGSFDVIEQNCRDAVASLGRTAA
jgi:2-dehydro-3-deoxyphosphogluconate aldolase/(4S)-4-hydroxy-2-oxoglutarate aldolase